MYVKAIRRGRVHNNYTWKLGRNVCPQPWNAVDGFLGGFYICKLEHLLEWIDMFPDVEECALVSVPEGSLVAHYETSVKTNCVDVHEFLTLEDTVAYALSVGMFATPEALRWAAGAGHAYIVEMLLRAGVDADAEDGLALCWAATGGHFATVQMLAQSGANVRSDDNAALCAAAAHGHADVVDLLLDWDASARARGNWPLRAAAACGYADVVDVLVRGGAYVYMDLVKETEGRGHTAAAEVLLAAL